MYNFIFRNIMHKLPKTHHFPPFTAQWFSTRFFPPVPGTISIHGSFNQKTIWTTGSSVYFLDPTIVQQIEKSKQLNKFFFVWRPLRHASSSIPHTSMDSWITLRHIWIHSHIQRTRFNSTLHVQYRRRGTGLRDNLLLLFLWLIWKKIYQILHCRTF